MTAEQPPTPQQPPRPLTREDIERIFTQRMSAAQAAEKAGKQAEAAELYAGLARDFPAHPMPHAQLGVVLRRLGKFEASIASFQRALSLAPDTPGILSSLGNAYRALG